MHRTKPHVEEEPAQIATEGQEVDESFSPVVAANQPDLEAGISRDDGPHVTIVLDSVMRALFEARRGVVRSSSSSISGAETEVELEPYSRYLRSGESGTLTHQAWTPREGISTAPTLHSRSSTPPGARQEKGETQKASEPPRREGKATSCHDDVFTKWLESFRKFWNEHISVQVPGKAARDHLAIERTFLAYHRTSMVFALVATVVAQLHLLNHKPNPSPTFGYYVLGKPLAVALIAFSIGLSIMGWWRWYTWQGNTIRGKVVVRGWELQSVGLAMMLFLLVLFGISLALLIEKAFFK